MRLLAAIVAAVIVIDQVSKALLRPLFGEDGADAIELFPFMTIVSVWNYGISFGLFNSGSPSWVRTAVFAVVSLCMVALLVLWYAGSERHRQQAALALLIGGALSNVVDRLVFGAVFDFLQLQAGEWVAPAFNVADAAIAVGLVLLVMDALFAARQSSK